MKTETVEVDERFGKEYAGRYVFQEISWAKRNRILQKYTRYNPQTGSILTTDYVAIQAETVMASLKEQPPSKPITVEKLLSENSEEGVPIELGELFSRIANKLCTVSRQETAFLSEPSEETSRTQPSRFIGSAKSSDGR
jgi:hypothetical protein